MTSKGNNSFHFAFILDQQVGLRTQAMNLKRVVDEDATVCPYWIPVNYSADAGLLTRLPGVPSSIKGTLRGIREIRDGFVEAPQLCAVLWATWAAKSVLDLVSATPSFLVMDMTPVQMEEMGAFYGYTRNRARFLGNWKRQATMRLYEKATHLFPWNEWVAESLRNDYGVPPEKITPISPGVDVDLFRPNPGVKPNDGVVRLLFVGGDFQRKGGDFLLRWAKENQPSEGRWELHLVTRDDVPDKIPGVFVHHGITNNSPELVRLYQQSDVFVLPTRADCYSLVALEAMACGVPVIISRLGGIPHIIEEGKSGYLIDVDDYHCLSERLSSLVATSDIRQQMGAVARQVAYERFDCRTGVSRILDRMKQAAKQGNP
ncbi:MAG: glycosyltransferase family 4 protein [Armatimonadaceae bacterium]